MLNVAISVANPVFITQWYSFKIKTAKCYLICLFSAPSSNGASKNFWWGLSPPLEIMGVDCIPFQWQISFWVPSPPRFSIPLSSDRITLFHFPFHPFFLPLLSSVPDSHPPAPRGPGKRNNICYCFLFSCTYICIITLGSKRIYSRVSIKAQIYFK